MYAGRSSITVTPIFSMIISKSSSLRPSKWRRTIPCGGERGDSSIGVGSILLQTTTKKRKLLCGNHDHASKAHSVYSSFIDTGSFGLLERRNACWFILQVYVYKIGDNIIYLSSPCWTMESSRNVDLLVIGINGSEWNLDKSRRKYFTRYLKKRKNVLHIEPWQLDQVKYWYALSYIM